MTDNVNHPQHYVNNSVTVTYEPIDLCRMYDFSIGNAIKYLIRFNDKGKPIEDLQKAKWYLLDALNQLEHGVNSQIHTIEHEGFYMRDCIKGFKTENNFIDLLINDQGVLSIESINNTVKAIDEEIERLLFINYF